MKPRYFAGLALAGLLTLANPAYASDIFQTYDLTWSGAPFENAASATGTITLDLSMIANPGQTDENSNPFVTDFSITVSNADSGNGTFGFSDYTGSPVLGGFYIITEGTLNFNSQLVGQPTPHGPWGSTQNGSTGDFNIFSNSADPNAPDGTNYFAISLPSGGQSLLLTSFEPVPEPSAAIPFSLLLAGAVIRGVQLKIRARRAN